MFALDPKRHLERSWHDMLKVPLNADQLTNHHRRYRHPDIQNVL